MPIVMPQILWLSTAAILASSMTFEIARRSLKRRIENKFKFWIGATTALGAGFLVLQLLAWSELKASGFYINKNQIMKTFILIHGSWHGSWNWHKVIPILESKGHKALPIDLPGMGKDKTPIQEVKFKNTVAKICELTPGDVSAEVTSLDTEGMLKEGREYAKIASNVVIKCPLTLDGLKRPGRSEFPTGVRRITPMSRSILSLWSGFRF